jgi:hypothetical protein
VKSETDLEKANHGSLHCAAILCISSRCNLSEYQTIGEELDTLNTLYNRRTYFVQNPTATIGAFHTRQSLEALWSDFFVATVTNIDHAITTSIDESSSYNLDLNAEIELMKLFLWF